MATTPTSGNECSIPMPVVEPTAHTDAGGGDEEQPGESSEEQPERRQCGCFYWCCCREQQTENSAAMVRRKLNGLNRIVFCVAFLEWAGNTVGTVAFIWATVVLLGGFCSLLGRMDFWFSAIMIFMEGSRVFIRNDASVNQWLFGSTSAFRWENLSSPGGLDLRSAKQWALMTGLGISFTPIEARPELVVGILKVALLVTFSQFQTGGIFAKSVISLVGSAAFLGGIVGALKLGYHYIKRSKANPVVSFLKIYGISLGWLGGILLAEMISALIIMFLIPLFKKNPVPQLCMKVIIASGLACLPFLQAILPSYYRYISIPIAIVLLMLSVIGMDQMPKEGEARGMVGMVRATVRLYGLRGSKQTVSSIRGLLLHILETILPILFIWSVMYPLPGISLKLSFYMLFSVIAGVLIANLQIPVAFLQVLLSVMRLHSLLDHHHHDYRPLPKDASPNLVPSIVVFYVMELCQGSSYILATILGLISIFCRIWLVRDLKFEKEWGADAVNLYHRQAYQARTVKGLLTSEKSTPSLPSFAIECLGSTSSETQIVGLRILDTFLRQWDLKSKRELIAEITSTSKKAVPILIHMLGSTVAGDKDIRLFAGSVITELIGTIKISDFPGMVKMISSLLDAKNQQDSLPPTDRAKIFKFPSVVKLISSLLDPNNQQDSLPNCVPENDGGDVDGRSQSICTTTDKSILLWLMSPLSMLSPLLGMSVLHKLADDSDNCAEMVEEATYITRKTIGLIGYLTSEEICGDPHQEIMLCSSLNFVRWLASNSRENGARFRQELSVNPFLLNSLEHILDLEDCQPELWELVMDIIAKLALDEAARLETGSTQVIIDKLIRAFLRQDVVNPSENNDRLLQMAAGKALANLTIESTDNCWAILLAEQGRDLIKKLIDMHDDEYYICVAANLLHNLCANSRDKMISLDAHMHLKSALPKVMQIIRTKEGKQLEAALGVASGYREYFAQMLKSDTDAAAAELIEKLVDTLKSNRKPCPDYPRIRRVTIEVVISIVESCPWYIQIFREKGVNDALDMVKGTPSRLEKHRVFLDGEGVVVESLPMRDLVDKARRLVDPGTPTPGAQSADHA